MKSIFIFLLITIFPSDKCIAQWTQTNGIFGSSVPIVYAVNGKVFAATGFGTMRLSYDGGKSYIIRTSGIKGVNVYGFTSINNTVFAYAGDSGIYKTTNDGINWVKSNTGLRNLNVSSLISKGNILCASTIDGFYTSTNEGANWIEPDPDFHLGISSLSTSNDFIYATIPSTILQSDNNGVSWDTSFHYNDHYVSFQNIESKDSEIYASGFINYLFRSTDSGLNWSRVTNAPGIIYSLKILDGKVLAATGSGGIYSSTDKGLTWSLDTNGISAYTSTRSISVDGDNIYVGVSGQEYPHSIYKSTDNGNNWIPSSANIIGTNIYFLKKIDNRIYASASYKGLFYTTDSGDNWINANTDLSSYDHSQIRSLGNCQSNYLMGSHRNFISTNSGQNWNTFGSSSNPHFYEFLNVNDTLLALKEYPWKSTDCGITWTASRNGFAAGNYGGELRYTGQYVYVIAGTSVSTSSLFRSGDFGNNWTRPLYTSSGFRLRHLAAKDSHVFLAYISQQDSGIIVSTDYGESFNNANTGLTCKMVNTLFVDSNHIFAGTTNGVFFKDLSGNQWQTLNNIDFNLNVTCFLSDSIYLYAGTKGDGIWRMPRNGIITSANNNTANALDFSLSQNYPNPFNPSTKITFNLEKSSLVKLSIYDISGKEIVRLINGNLDEGNHDITFNGKDLPSGVYFAKLTSGEQNSIIKMVLAK